MSLCYMELPISLLIFVLDNQGYILHKKYGIMHYLNHNNNFTKKKKSYVLVKINLEMGQDF